MIVSVLIELAKALKAVRKVRTESWGVIILQRRAIWAVLVVFVIGKVGDFLCQVVSLENTNSCSKTKCKRAVGRLIAECVPAKRSRGWMSNR